MTTTVLRAVKFMEARIDRLRDDPRYPQRGYRKIEEALKFMVFLTGPILLPIIIMCLEASRY